MYIRSTKQKRVGFRLNAPINVNPEGGGVGQGVGI